MPERPAQPVENLPRLSGRAAFTSVLVGKTVNFYISCAISFLLGVVTPFAIWVFMNLWRALAEFRRELRSLP